MDWDVHLERPSQNRSTPTVLTESLLKRCNQRNVSWTSAPCRYGSGIRLVNQSLIGRMSPLRNRNKSSVPKHCLPCRVKRVTQTVETKRVQGRKRPISTIGQKRRPDSEMPDTKRATVQSNWIGDDREQEPLTRPGGKSQQLPRKTPRLRLGLQAMDRAPRSIIVNAKK